MRHTTPQFTVQVELHKLPRKDRIWLCERMGYRPTHWGIVSLHQGSKVYGELKIRIGHGIRRST